VCAQLFDMACMRMLGASLSATSLLIIVGTVMQSSRQVRGAGALDGSASCKSLWSPGLCHIRAHCFK